jgi:hypothetical protein
MSIHLENIQSYLTKITEDLPVVPETSTKGKNIPSLINKIKDELASLADKEKASTKKLDEKKDGIKNITAQANSTTGVKLVNTDTEAAAALRAKKIRRRCCCLTATAVSVCFMAVLTQLGHLDKPLAWCQGELHHLGDIISQYRR